MIIKSYIIEKSFDELNKFKLILFYGENEGLKKNFRDLIRINYKNTEIFNLFQDEIIKDEKKLFNNLHNSSLFYSTLFYLTLFLLNLHSERMISFLPFVSVTFRTLAICI